MIMTDFRFVTISLLVASTLSAGVALAEAPVPQLAPPAPKAAAPAAPKHGTEEAGKPIADASIYQLDSSWTRSDGTKIQLSSLRGNVRVLAIFYSSCEYACPIIVGRMKSVQEKLAESKVEGAGFVLVSMDPGHDDPKRLREYSERMGLEGDWTLLQGNDGDVRELAALLGFRYRQEKEGDFAHSNMMTVLDREGRIAFRALGLDSDVGEAVDAVKKQVP